MFRIGYKAFKRYNNTHADFKRFLDYSTFSQFKNTKYTDYKH